MNHATGGRDELDPRFLSLCTVFAVPRPTDDTIRDVFRSILAGHTASFGDGVRSAARGLIDMTVHLYKVRVLRTNFGRPRHGPSLSVRFDISVGAQATPSDAGQVHVRVQLVPRQFRR